MNYYKIAICFLLFTGNVYAQGLVSLSETNIDKTVQGNLITITLPFKIAEGYHIQSEIESLGNSLPTEIMFEENDLFEIVSFDYSKKHNEKVVLDEYAHSVLINTFEVTVILKLHDNVVNSGLQGQLFYQACTNKQCLFPRTLDFNVPHI